MSFVGESDFLWTTLYGILGTNVCAGLGVSQENYTITEDIPLPSEAERSTAGDDEVDDDDDDENDVGDSPVL